MAFLMMICDLFKNCTKYLLKDSKIILLQEIVNHRYKLM